MSKTIAIVGFGPGNSTAIAEKFGAEGFSVGLVGRNMDRLTAGASALKARGITAGAYQGDAADPMTMRAAFGNIRTELGPISVMNWNAALGGSDAGDVLTADPALKSAGDGAILITNGGFGDPSPEIDETAVKLNVADMALANAAKHKLAGLLGQRLKGDGVYVGEVMIYGIVKGTPSGNDNGVDPAIVANAFWDLYRSRADLRARVG